MSKAKKVARAAVSRKAKGKPAAKRAPAAKKAVAGKGKTVKAAKKAVAGKRKTVKVAKKAVALAAKPSRRPKAVPAKSKGKRPAPRRPASVKGPEKPVAPAMQPRKGTIDIKREAPVAKHKQPGMRPVREALLKRREFLLRNLGRLTDSASGAADKPVGDRVDDASIDVEVDSVYSIAEHETEELRLIDVALENIANGTYGICTECHQPIEKARLKALPYAVLCLKCKQAEEVEHVRAPDIAYGEMEEE
jgi:RNA polymerase-binding transcription factor DksA